MKYPALALSGSLTLLLVQPAFAQVSESELAPPAPAAESEAAPSANEGDPNATTTASEPAPAAAAPLVVEATTPPLTDEPVGQDPNAPPPPAEEPVAVAPVAEEPLAETTTSDPEPNLDLLLKRPTPFDQGRLRIGVGLGWTSTSNTDWLILGAGLGVYVLDGLEVGLDSTFWVIGDPFVSTLTPGLRYVFIQLPTVKPYIGAFYRHYFVGDGYDDTDAIGGRLGVYFMLSQQAYLGGGIVYEHFLDDDLFASRDQFYPELTFSFAF